MKERFVGKCADCGNEREMYGSGRLCGECLTRLQEERRFIREERRRRREEASK